MDKKELPIIILAFASIYIIWGSTYLFNKIIVVEIPPLLLACVRFVSAGVIVLVISRFFNVDQKLSRKQYQNTAIAGLLFLTLGNGTAVWALQYLDSGLTAILISAQPLLLLFMLRILEHKKIKTRSLFGALLGLVGIYLLVSQVPIHGNENQWKGILGIFACLLVWGYGSIFVGKADLPANSMLSTGYQMLFGGGMLLIGSLIFREDFESLLSVSNKAMWSMLYLIVFGSIIAFSSFNFLLQRFSPEKVATNTYVNPIVAMILGAWILNEELTGQSIIASAILLTGVYFINSSKRS